MKFVEGMVVAERFQLLRELGQGGMGSVWLAHHVSLDIPCALKFIHAEAAQLPEIRARFEREARAAAQLRCVNVVGILDYGLWNDMPYIAMEYLQGEDLAARLKRAGRLSPYETVSMITQIARALTKAHAAGLVHRDLKPENIFLVREDDQETAKVLDFGIAKAQNVSIDSSTRTGALLGTPFFMSPEQAQGTKNIDYRSDLWSLAVVAFRCITGELPFTSEAFGDLLLRIMVNPLPVPSQVAPGVPPTFDAWWQRGAARDPAHRFQSAKELGETLAAALGVTPMPGNLHAMQLMPESRLPSTPNYGGYPTPGHEGSGPRPYPVAPDPNAQSGAPAYGSSGSMQGGHVSFDGGLSSSTGGSAPMTQGSAVHGQPFHPMQGNVFAPHGTPNPSVHTFNGLTSVPKTSAAPFVIGGAVALLGALAFGAWFLFRSPPPVVASGDPAPVATAKPSSDVATQATNVVPGAEVPVVAPTVEPATSVAPAATSSSGAKSGGRKPSSGSGAGTRPQPTPTSHGDFGF